MGYQICKFRVQPKRSICLAALALIPGTPVYGEMSGDADHATKLYLEARTVRHSSASFSGGTGSVRTDEYGLAFGLLDLRRGSAVLDIGVDYVYTHLAFDDVPSRNRDVHKLQFPLRFSIDAGSKELRGYVAPGIATSSNVFKDFFNRGSSDDLTIAGKIEIESAHDRRSWFAGAAYDQAFGGPRLYPVVGINAMPRDDLRIRIAFPESEVWYRLSDRHTISTRVFPSGNRWRVVTDDFSADFDLRREEWRVQLTWSFVALPFLAFDLSAGQAFDRQLTLNDRDGSRIDSPLASELFTEIGFRLGDVANTRR